MANLTWLAVWQRCALKRAVHGRGSITYKFLESSIMLKLKAAMLFSLLTCS